MKSRCLFPPSFFYRLTLTMLIVPVTQAIPNQAPIANAGIDQYAGLSKLVTLDGRRSVDKDGSIKKYQWSEIVADKVGAALKLPPTVVLINPLTVRSTFKSPSKSRKLYFKLEVIDQAGAKASNTVAITVAELNDTGITACGIGTENGLVCPVEDYPGQDAQLGRDVTSNNNADGIAGFSFTKISSKGAVLPASATSWNCVKDNVTGLVWEVKTDNGGLHDKDWSYTWYEPDGTKNGGNVGTTTGGSCAGSVCNTYAYVKAVNAAGWCGAKDWRMPTVDELFSIALLNGIIDTQYFPNTLIAVFWSSSPSASYGSLAWTGAFSYGHTDWGAYKDTGLQVRLVRSGQ
jgi:Protein of unknown function (DUF1566)